MSPLAMAERAAAAFTIGDEAPAPVPLVLRRMAPTGA
jgi:hypothetical protein